MCVTQGGGAGTARLPAKNIVLNLIGIHDPDSDDYNGNCIGCHGDRTGEMAADGTTPAAHARMLTQFGGEGNERCTSCHPTGPDFLTYSRGGLREQVDMERLNCAACHGPQSTPSFYAG